MTDNLTLSVKQVARKLNVSPSLVYALCAAGRLAHHRIGLGRGVIRIEAGAILSVMKSSQERESYSTDEIDLAGGVR
jgi:excisionase family DNA binding protein